MKIQIMYKKPTGRQGARIHLHPYIEEVDVTTFNNRGVMKVKSHTRQVPYLRIPPETPETIFDGQIAEVDLTKHNAEVLLHFMKNSNMFELVDPMQLPFLEQFGPFKPREPMYKRNDPRDPEYQKTMKAEKIQKSQDAIQVHVHGDQVQHQYGPQPVPQVVNVPYIPAPAPKVVQVTPVPEVTTTSEAIPSPLDTLLGKPEWEKLYEIKDLKAFAKKNEIKIGQGRQSRDRLWQTIKKGMEVIARNKELVGG